MGYERYPRGTNPQGDDYNRSYSQDYGSRGHAGGRDYGYSSARDYAAAGQFEDRDDDRYGRREYGYERYGQRDRASQSRGYEQGGYGRQDRDDRYGAQARSDEHRRSYGGDSGRYSATGGYGRDMGDRHNDRMSQDRSGQDRYGQGRYGQGRQGQYGRQPQGYDYEERGFFDRAGDEVRSWFGDEEAERRREADARNDERYYAGQHDDDYHGWRQNQLNSFDRDYDEYRQENRSRFEKEFSAWRTTRQSQRDQLTQVKEHQEVVGSDGSHVGTVDKVHGDRIVLTKSDTDAGGRHHSIPSRWVQSVDDKVTLSKTADEAKQAWKDEDANSAMFGRNDANRGYGTSTTGSDAGQNTDRGTTNLNRSFSGTY